MNKNEFAKLYMEGLDPQQREAVTAVHGPVLLLAVPGSGKTRVLVTRLGYFTEVEGIPPEKILAVTYTVAATREMRERYTALFGAENGTPEFRTINGISQKIIDCYGRTCSRSDPFRLEENTAELDRLLREIHLAVNREYADDSDVKDLHTGITYAKNMMLDDAALEHFESPVDHFPEIFRRYNGALREQRKMDYDDQMVYALGILKHRPQVLQIFREKYDFLCVDESQDTSKIQHAILRLLAGENPNLFMVGDEDQSIYGFRAAYPEALVRFREDYPGAKILYLEQNYRSAPEIVDVANRFVSGNRERYPKTAKAVRPVSNVPVSRISAGSRTKQFEEAFRVAQTADRETAFLFRNNDTALPLIDLFERNSVLYNCRQFDGGFFNSKIVTDLRDIAAFIQHPADAELFMKLYYKFSCRIPKEAAEATAKKAALTGDPVLRTFLRSRSLKPWLRDSVQELQHHFHELPEDSATVALTRIRLQMGYGEYVRERGMDETKLDTLHLLAKGEENLFTLIDRIETLRRIVSEHTNSPRNLVTLSTIHSAKGLEFERVFLLDVADGILPSVTAAEAETREEKKLAQEERRLFYVGMTRAKNELTLFSCGRSSSFIAEALGENQKQRSGWKQNYGRTVERAAGQTENTDMVRKNGLLIPEKKG